MGGGLYQHLYRFVSYYSHRIICKDREGTRGGGKKWEMDRWNISKGGEGEGADTKERVVGGGLYQHLYRYVS